MFKLIECARSPGTGAANHGVRIRLHPADIGPADRQLTLMGNMAPDLWQTSPPHRQRAHRRGNIP